MSAIQLRLATVASDSFGIARPGVRQVWEAARHGQVIATDRTRRGALRKARRS